MVIKKDTNREKEDIVLAKTIRDFIKLIIFPEYVVNKWGCYGSSSACRLCKLHGYEDMSKSAPCAKCVLSKLGQELCPCWTKTADYLCTALKEYYDEVGLVGYSHIKYIDPVVYWANKRLSEILSVLKE